MVSLMLVMFPLTPSQVLSEGSLVDRLNGAALQLRASFPLHYLQDKLGSLASAISFCTLFTAFLHDSLFCLLDFLYGMFTLPDYPSPYLFTWLPLCNLPSQVQTPLADILQ